MEFFDSVKKWFYTNNSQAASSDARIPLLTATGEPKGSDTMANIASVLGGIPYRKTISADDLDTLFTNGCYYLPDSGSLNLGPASLVVYRWASGLSNACQIVTSIGGTQIKIRYYSNSNWQTWKTIITQIG